MGEATGAAARSGPGLLIISSVLGAEAEESPGRPAAGRAGTLLSVQPVCDDGGGSERALIAMIRQLGDDGWECHVAVPGRPKLTELYQAAGARLHVVPMRPLTTRPAGQLSYLARWPGSVVRLARLIRSLDADVVHSNSLLTWNGFAAARLTGRPHVWHAREIIFQSAAALRIVRRLARRYATRVIAVSRATAEQLDPANVVIVTDQIDSDRFRPDRAGRFRPRVGIDDGAVLLGSVARIDTWKGFEVLLDAFPAVRAARPDVELVVAGGTVAGREDYEARLRARAGGMAGVHWLGYREDVPDLMADLDVFVQVSTEPEPYGLVVAEALATGVPVVAGAAGGPVEILAGAPPGAGRLVAPGSPGGLADGVLDLLPARPSTVESRRARRPYTYGSALRFSELFDAVTAGSAR